MVLKEFVSAAYHLLRFYNEVNYPARFQSLVSSMQSAASNMMNDDWHAPIFSYIDVLQNALVEYESTTGFPFDNNPLLLELGLNDFISVSGLESVKDLTKMSLDEARQLCNEGLGKIQASQNMLQTLNGEFDKLNVKKDAMSFYDRHDNMSLLRVTFPAQSASLLDSDQLDLKNLINALKGIGRLEKSAGSYDYSVISVNQSSPFDVLLLVAGKYGVALNIFLKSFNKRWREIEDTREVRAKIRHLNAKTDVLKAKKEQMLKDLASFEDTDDSRLQNIVDEVMKTLAHEGVELDGTEPEVREAIKKSMKFFEKNLEKGGAVNVYVKLKSDAQSIDITRTEIIKTRMPQSHLESARKLIQG